jgi:hypothetical protein
MHPIDRRCEVASTCPPHRFKPAYFALSASAGSTAAALRAGIQLASAAIATSVREAPASVSGSLAAMPYRNVRRNRATSANMANPPATPKAVNRSP